MNSDRLENLLRQADAVLADAALSHAASAADGPSPEILASSVRRLARYRRQRTLLVGAGFALLVSSAALWQGGQFAQVAKQVARRPDASLPDKPTPESPSPAEQMQSALATIDSEQQSVDRLLMAERLQRARQQTDTLQAPLALPAADMEQLDRAASALVLCAERKELRPQLLAAARDDYNLIVRLFPNTPWADLAQVRLMNLAPANLTPQPIP